MATLDELVQDVEALEALAFEFEEGLDALKARLRAYKASLGRLAKDSYIRPDGRLSEAGVRYCNKAFEQGRGPTEIANALGVTVPAIVMRRKNWRAAKRKSGKSRRSS